MLKIYIQFGSRSPTGSKKIKTTYPVDSVSEQKKTMEAKFYKWSVSFSDGIDQVVMIYSGMSCRVNDFGINQKIEYYDYELNVDDMIPATEDEFIITYAKVYGDMFRRMWYAK